MASYSVDLWDQFDAVAKRTNDGRVFSKNAATWYEKRAECEAAYSKKLAALAKSLEVDFGSSQNGWTTLKVETELLSRKHADNAQRTVECLKPILDDLKATAKPRDKLEAQGKKLLKDLKAAEEKEISAKANFEKLRHTQDQTKDEYERATFNNAQSKLVDKLSKKLKADTKKAASADAAYSDAVHKLAAMQDKVYRQDMPRVLDELQRIEEQRIATLSSVLSSFAAILSSLGPEVLSLSERVSVAGQSISPSADVAAFVAEKRTGAQIPPPATYEPYDPDTGRCAPKSGGGGASASSVAGARASVYSAGTSGAGRQSFMAPASSDQLGQHQSFMAPPAAAAAEAPQYVGRCRALYTYEPQDPAELAFQEGDIINVLQRDDSGWWQGELHGVIKVFPFADWCEEID